MIMFSDGSEVVGDGDGDTLAGLFQHHWVEAFGDRWAQEYYRHSDQSQTALVDGSVQASARTDGPLDSTYYTGTEQEHR